MFYHDSFGATRIRRKWRWYGCAPADWFPLPVYDWRESMPPTCLPTRFCVVALVRKKPLSTLKRPYYRGLADGQVSCNRFCLLHGSMQRGEHRSYQIEETPLSLFVWALPHDSSSICVFYEACVCDQVCLSCPLVIHVKSRQFMKLLIKNVPPGPFVEMMINCFR